MPFDLVPQKYQPAPISREDALWGPAFEPVPEPEPIPDVPAPAGPPPVPASPHVHAVAKCRWCGGRFWRAFTLPPQWLCLSAACAERQIASAIPRIVPPGYVAPVGQSPWLFIPLPLNIDLAESPYKRTLLAGAAGASKSFGARWMLYRECLKQPGFRALVLRESYDALNKNWTQYLAGETSQLQTFGHGVIKVTGAYYKTVNFENGASILIGYCAHETDVPKHLGADWDRIVIDEAVNQTPRAISEIPARDRGSPTARAFGVTDGKSWLLSNPGGQGMIALSDFFIRKQPDPAEYPHYDPNDYGYIHATLEDNPHLAEDYASKTLGGLSARRYQQMRFGNWDVYTGAFLTEWDPTLHVGAIEGVQ